MKQLYKWVIDLKHKIKKQKEWEDGKIHSSWTTTKVKCLHQMFTVWSTKSADHWAGRPHAWFQQQGNKKGKILDPPFCWLPGRREQMGHTQQYRHHCPPRQSSSLTTESTHKYSIFIQMLLCTHFIYLDFRQHYLSPCASVISALAAQSSELQSRPIYSGKGSDKHIFKLFLLLWLN